MKGPSPFFFNGARALETNLSLPRKKIPRDALLYMEHVRFCDFLFFVDHTWIERQGFFFLFFFSSRNFLNCIMSSRIEIQKCNWVLRKVDRNFRASVFISHGSFHNFFFFDRGLKFTKYAYFLCEFSNLIK